MGNTLKLEELAMFLFSIFMFSLLGFAWWWYPVLLLLPDIGMLGYLANNRIGAITYNIFHHKGVALLFIVLGYFQMNDWVILCGIILFGHASMDRMFGFGLKYADNFKHTHLDQF